MNDEARIRLDLLLVERGLAPSRAQARDLIRRGCVSLGSEALTKPGALLTRDAVLELAEGSGGYVSRGAIKLAAALDAFGFDAVGRVALDIGASTGGFTQVLLERGASRVYAVDVGRDQLHARLRGDARIVSLEKTDARKLGPALIPESVGAIVADLSFISLTQALDAALNLAAPDAWLVALVKPQFEAGREAVGKGGIVRDPAAQERAVARVKSHLESGGWQVTGCIPSPVTGGDGNREFLLGAVRPHCKKRRDGRG